MVDGCLGKTVQFILFLTNFLVFVLGCVVLGFGAYVLITGNDLVSLIDSTDADSIKLYGSASILLIVIACAVVLVTFFGCCGAWKVNRCMLGTYFVMILALFICILVGAVIAYTQDLSFVTDALKETQEKYGQDGNDEKIITDAWDSLQESFECCGVTNRTDWSTAKDKGAIFTDRDGNTPPSYEVPNTCCNGIEADDKYKQCMGDDTMNPPDGGYSQGCWTKFQEDVIEANKNYILYSGITIIVIMFLNMLSAFAMCTMAGKD